MRNYTELEDTDVATDYILESDYFDPEWYSSHYGDVALLNAEPMQHFLKWGRLLERSPGPEFDTKFYLSRYGDVGSNNPLLYHLQAADKNARPVNRRRLQEKLKLLDHDMHLQWQSTAPQSTRPKPPIISYCIPLMGRLADIQGTLAENLAAHAEIADLVEFLVILFGDYATTATWIQSQFQDEIACGLLRVVIDNTLDSWHFGKAKNAFRPHILGQIYSSLDGDNFVTLAETNRVFDLHHQYDGHFSLHHFSGQWGDGTSGRITLPASVYRTVGYDDRLLPRQFDEIDILLRALKAFPAMPFLCVDPTQNLITRSRFARKFITDEKLPNRVISIGDCSRRPPLNPRGEGYARATPYLNHMGNLNAGISGFGASSDPKRAAAYMSQLTADKHRLLATLPRERMLETFFYPARPRDAEYRIQRGQICAFLVVKNEPHFLPPLLEHYRRIGVTDFFIVDDGSDLKVEDLLPAPDVHVFHPKVGSFRTLKTAWIEALMHWFLPAGNWALTIDADEFIHLPGDFGSLGVLTRHLEAQGHDFMPGLMIDLLPAPSATPSELSRAEGDFEQLFTHCCYTDRPVAPVYQAHASIQWAFGKHAALSWRIDIRNHAFGTFDSLRKIPLLQWRPDRHLNQGFHTLHPADKQPAPGHEIWEQGPILPVHHYKLVRLFSDQTRQQMLREAGNYHARTGENLTRIFGGNGSDSIALLSKHNQHFIPVSQLHQHLGWDVAVELLQLN